MSKLSFLRAKGKTTGGFTAHSSVLSCCNSLNSPLEIESLLAGYVIGNYLIKYMVVNGRGWSLVEREPCTELKCKFKVELHVLENPRDSCRILELTWKRWLPHRLSKHQSLSTTTVLFRSSFTRMIRLNLLLKWLLGSNLSQFKKTDALIFLPQFTFCSN